jgi:hypothetical protein
MADRNPFAASQVEGISREDDRVKEGQTYVTIGGWLIVLALELGLNVVVGVVGVFYFGPLAVRTLVLWLIVRTVINLALGVASVAALMLMFQRSRFFPALATGYLLGCLLLGLGNAAFNGFRATSFLASSRPLAECLVWIPYLIRSWRVRSTFVR